MTDKQPEALRIAHVIEGYACCTLGPKMDQAAALLRTQHAAIERKDALLRQVFGVLDSLFDFEAADHCALMDAIKEELQ